MARLKVIAVENIAVSSIDTAEPVIACVYKDNLLHVYDTFGELYHQKEYFGNFESLEYLIKKGKYEWADFYIEKGQLVTRDIHGDIVVEGDTIDPFLPLEEGNNSMSDVSLKIYYEFLKTINKSDSVASEILKNCYESGGFRKEIEEIVNKSPFSKFNDLDKELIVRTKIGGYQYIVNTVKKVLKTGDYYRFDDINYMFSRLFKLEKHNYIVL